MLEYIIDEVCEKYRLRIAALQAAVASDEGLPYMPCPPMTEEQKQRLLFGHLFTGLDKPLRRPNVL
jgi:hypothetical protein